MDIQVRYDIVKAVLETQIKELTVQYKEMWGDDLTTCPDYQVEVRPLKESLKALNH